MCEQQCQSLPSLDVRQLHIWRLVLGPRPGHSQRRLLILDLQNLSSQERFVLPKAGWGQTSPRSRLLLSSKQVRQDALAPQFPLSGRAPSSAHVFSDQPTSPVQ